MNQQQHTSSRKTYTLNLATFFNINLFTNGMNVSSCHFFCRDFSILMPGLTPPHANQISPNTILLGHCHCILGYALARTILIGLKIKLSARLFKIHRSGYTRLHKYTVKTEYLHRRHQCLKTQESSVSQIDEASIVSRCTSEKGSVASKCYI